MQQREERSVQKISTDNSYNWPLQVTTLRPPPGCYWPRIILNSRHCCKHQWWRYRHHPPPPIHNNIQQTQQKQSVKLSEWAQPSQDINHTSTITNDSRTWLRLLYPCLVYMSVEGIVLTTLQKVTPCLKIETETVMKQGQHSRCDALDNEVAVPVMTEMN